MSIEVDNEEGKRAKLLVIGVGGGGNNAVSRMIDENVENVDFAVMNTDRDVLMTNKAPIKLQLGEKLTKGLGAGADPAIGEKAAEESKEEITVKLQGYDMVFITAGMGGGTGTGAAPIIAEIAQSLGILTVAVVTKPFKFEGRRKTNQAVAGIEKLKDHVDSLIIVPNDNVLNIVDDKSSVASSFKMVDQVLCDSVIGIIEIITRIGDINIDFADVKTVMSKRGIVHMGRGLGSGKDRCTSALQLATSNPLLETTINGAKAIIVNYYGDNISMMEMSDCSDTIEDLADPDALIITGMKNATDDMNDQVVVTVIAAGFDDGDGVNNGQQNVQPAQTSGQTSSFSFGAAPASQAQPKADAVDIPPFLFGHN